jgi:hypothetical protein
LSQNARASSRNASRSSSSQHERYPGIQELLRRNGGLDEPPTL